MILRRREEKRSPLIPCLYPTAVVERRRARATPSGRGQERRKSSPAHIFTSRFFWVRKSVVRSSLSFVVFHLQSGVLFWVWRAAFLKPPPVCVISLVYCASFSVCLMYIYCARCLFEGGRTREDKMHSCFICRSCICFLSCLVLSSPSSRACTPCQTFKRSDG